MRILHVIHQYLPEKVGGTELYTRTLAKSQVVQNHQVAIFTPSVDEDNLAPDTFALDDGVRVYRVPMGSRGATAVFRHNFHQPQLNNAFRAVLSQEEPDLVHIQHLMGLPISIVTQINHAGIPYVISLHDYWHLCANAQLFTNYDSTICKGPNLWLNCARCALARSGHDKALPLIPAIAPLFAHREWRLTRILKGARFLIAPTHFTRQIYLQMGTSAEKILVIPHGISVPDELPPLTTSASELHIGYIGGLSPQKGIHILIDAVNQLPLEGCRLSIIGDTAVFPDYITHLKQQARHPGIEFKGRMPHDKLWEALAQIDVVVVPSLWYETASLIIQEAFAAGVPVVASRIGAIQERIREGIDGHLFPSGDANALRDILEQLRAEKSLLEKLQAGIRPVRTIQDHINDIESIYSQVVH